MGFFDRIKEGIKKTKEAVAERLDDVIANFRKVDEDMLEELEEALILADLPLEDPAEFAQLVSSLMV